MDFQDGAMEVERVIQLYPQAKMLRIKYPEDDDDLELICSLTNLEMLCLLHGRQTTKPAPQRLPFATLLAGLESLPKLRFLKLEVTAADLEMLQQALPNCEIILTRHGP